MMMTLAEFPDPDLPAHRNAVEGKSWLRKTIGALTDRLGVDDPAELADGRIDICCAQARELHDVPNLRLSRGINEAGLPNLSISCA
jgi:hypothetical protein